MGSLNPDQVRIITEYLNQQGLKDKPLQADLLDHVCCHVEMYMEEGDQFEEAVKKVKLEIPKHQLKKIQTETMEVINKRTQLTKVLTLISFSGLVLASVFKLLQLPGAAELLISSFVLLAMTLITGLFTNPLIKQRERGRHVTIAFLLSMLTYLASLCFQLLHLPGASSLRLVSVMSSILILSGYAIYHYLNPKITSRHIIMEYVKRQSWSIEKSLIILFGFGLSLKLWRNDFVSIVFFMMLFVFGSVFYFVKCWPYISSMSNNSMSRRALLVVSIMAYSMFMLPTILNLIDIPMRIAMIWGTAIVTSATVAIYYLYDSKDNHKYLLAFFSFLLAVVNSLNLVGKSVLVGSGLGDHFISISYSPFVISSMSIVFLLYFKRPVARALFLMTISLYIHTYQMSGI